MFWVSLPLVCLNKYKTFRFWILRIFETFRFGNPHLFVLRIIYPFGYGLSYTTFKYDNVKLSSANLKKEDVLTVTFDLENTGKYEGTEVAQLYVQDKFASVTRPVKELKRFARVTLKPGEKKNVSFELPISELAFWNIDMVKTVEAGDFALWVAPDSQSGEEVFFKVVD